MSEREPLSHLLRKMQPPTNDAELVDDMRYYAEQGNVDAQYAMGVIYSEGRGVPLDPARAHYWLSKAVNQGDLDAVKLRNLVGAYMTDEQYKASVRMRYPSHLRVVGTEPVEKP